MLVEGSWFDELTTSGVVRRAHHERGGSTSSPRAGWFDAAHHDRNAGAQISILCANLSKPAGHALVISLALRGREASIARPLAFLEDRQYQGAMARKAKLDKRYGVIPSAAPGLCPPELRKQSEASIARAGEGCRAGIGGHTNPPFAKGGSGGIWARRLGHPKFRNADGWNETRADSM